jgi:hypothetical protein
MGLGTLYQKRCSGENASAIFDENRVKFSLTGHRHEREMSRRDW